MSLEYNTNITEAFLSPGLVLFTIPSALPTNTLLSLLRVKTKTNPADMYKLGPVATTRVRRPVNSASGNRAPVNTARVDR